MALQGARVIGLDRDESVLEHAARLARDWGAEEDCVFICSRSEQMALAAESVDVVFSLSTLQYMHKAVAIDECMRVLKPGGALVLIENLAHNPFLKLYRLLRARSARSPESLAYVGSIQEYFTLQEVRSLGGRFVSIVHREYYLFSIFSSALRTRFKRWRWLKALDRALSRLDAFVLRKAPFLRPLGWFVAIVAKGKY